MSDCTPSRRRFMSIAAAAIALPSAAVGAVPTSRWRGIALGAPASIQLAGVDRKTAAPVFRAIEAEIARLERVFSLYIPVSEISQLNRDGALRNPSPEMLELLSLSGGIHKTTDGAFDPTVQPIWRAYAKADGGAPDADALTVARDAVGWDLLTIGDGEIAFQRPGMALTLNGIAQGYVADKVASVLRGYGFQRVLIDMGEIAAIGGRPDGAPWRAGIAAPDGELAGEAALSDRALATSAPGGTLIGASKQGHILNPMSGDSRSVWRLASVSARRAAVADGLSTAFCLLPKELIDAVLRAYPDARLEVLA